VRCTSFSSADLIASLCKDKQPRQRRHSTRVEIVLSLLAFRSQLFKFLERHQFSIRQPALESGFIDIAGGFFIKIKAGAMLHEPMQRAVNRETFPSNVVSPAFTFSDASAAARSWPAL